MSFRRRVAFLLRSLFFLSSPLDASLTRPSYTYLSLRVPSLSFSFSTSTSFLARSLSPPRSPIIQPILDNRPPSPSQELHYFRDSSNQWREIVGRDAAEEILRASGAEGTDETISWVDERAVRAERKELQDLVAGKERKERAGRVAEVRGVTGEHRKMVGDEREEDGRAKVVRGVAL